MLHTLIDLSPVEAVSSALEEPDHEVATTALDRYLRHRLLVYSQSRDGEPSELRHALLAAARWAEQRQDQVSAIRWRHLLELLHDAERTPAVAAELAGLDADVLDLPAGRPAEVLAFLATEGAMRPQDLASELGISPQHVTNIVRRLEEAGLVLRRSGAGKARWVGLTLRGQRMAARLGTRPRQSQDDQEAATVPPFWTHAADEIRVA